MILLMTDHPYLRVGCHISTTNTLNNKSHSSPVRRRTTTTTVVAATAATVVVVAVVVVAPPTPLCPGMCCHRRYLCPTRLDDLPVHEHLHEGSSYFSVFGILVHSQYSQWLEF
jgi:hypothetical protein